MKEITKQVDTPIGQFTIVANDNATGQKIWKVKTCPASFEPTRNALNLNLDEVLLTAYEGDIAGINASKLLRSMLPISEVKAAQQSEPCHNARIKGTYKAGTLARLSRSSRESVKTTRQVEIKGTSVRYLHKKRD